MNKNKPVLGGLVLLLASINASHAEAQDFIDVARGGFQICAITTANELLCSTSAAASRLIPPITVPALAQVGVGDVHACGLDLNGSVICWGDNDFGQLDVPADRVYESISVGWNHTCAITAELETDCWGLPSNDRLAVPTDGLPFIEVFAGLTRTCGLEAAGGIRCWGPADYRFDPPSANADIVSFATTQEIGETSTLCALLANGEIECDLGSYQFPGTYTDIGAWGKGICALNTNGDIECQNTSATQRNEIATLNQSSAFTRITSHTGICLVDDAAGIACTSAASTPSTGPAQRFTNELALPGVASAGPLAADDLSSIIYSETTVELFWTAIQKGGDGRVTGAEIYRNGALLVRTGNFNSYVDLTLEPGADYEYEVRIVNSNGEVGPPGNLVVINTGTGLNTGEPTYKRPTRLATPGNFVAEDLFGSIELIWDDNSGNVFGYEVYRDHQYIGFTDNTFFNDADAVVGREYHYDVLAVDEAGTILGFAGGVLQ